MPVSGPQQPGFYLPGAEYFALSPNTNIALQGRRRLNTTIASTSVGAGLVHAFALSTQLESVFPATAGVFVHRMDMVLFPGDTSGELQVVSSLVSISYSGATGSGVPLGLPIVTQTSPVGALVALHDQDVLLNGYDIAAGTAVGFQPPIGAPIFLDWIADIKNNDPTNPHAMQINVLIIYSRLDGIQE